MMKSVKRLVINEPLLERIPDKVCNKVRVGTLYPVESIIRRIRMDAVLVTARKQVN